MRYVELVSNAISKNKLEQLRRVVTKAHERRFRRRREPKYGSLNKGFTDQELQAFFKVINNNKFRLLFSYQAQLALRIGELAKLNIKDIDFKNRELTLKGEKSKTIATLLIPVQLFKQTLDYIKANESAIIKAHGYLFFKDAGKHSTRSVGWLSPDYIRNRFRHYVEKAGLDQTYDISDELRPDRTPRRLNRLTTHSLRHYAITHFAQQNNGNVLLTSSLLDM